MPSSGYQGPSDDYRYFYGAPDPRPFTCPVCGGRGNVPLGFYNMEPRADAGTPTWTTGTAVTESCRSCQGTGIVWKS